MSIEELSNGAVGIIGRKFWNVEILKFPGFEKESFNE